MLNRFFYVKKDELLGLAGDPDSDPVFKNQSQYLNMDTLYRTGETNQVNFFFHLISSIFCKFVPFKLVIEIYW